MTPYPIDDASVVLEVLICFLFSCILQILMLLCNNGLLFIGYDLLHGYICQGQSQEKSNTVDGFSLYFCQLKPLLKAAEDISIFLSRFIAASSITCTYLKSTISENDGHHEVRSIWLNAQGYYFQSIIFSLWSLRAAMGIFCGSFPEELITPLFLLDLYEYYVHFASAWLQRNSKGLLQMLQPILITFTSGHTPYEVDMKNLKTFFHQSAELLTRNTSIDNVVGDPQVSKFVDDERGRDLVNSIPDDERWEIMGACLWQHMSRFMKHKLNSMSIKLDENHSSSFLGGYLSSWTSSLTNPESASIGLTEQMRLLTLILAQLLKSTLLHVSSHHVKQLAFFLQCKVENGFDIPTRRWLEESTPSQSGTLYQHLNQGVVSMNIMNKKDEVALSELLWDVCSDPSIIYEGFAQEELNWRSYINCKLSKGWSHINEGVKMKHEIEKTCKNEDRLGNTLASGEVGSASKDLFQNSHASPRSWHKDANMANEVIPFQAHKEICKRNGELFEVSFLTSCHCIFCP